MRKIAELGELAQFKDFAATNFGFQLKGVPSPFKFTSFANLSSIETGVARNS